MEIKFLDNTKLECMVVNGQRQFVQNANRDTLEFVFLANGNSMDAIASAFNDKTKTRQIKIVNDEQENVYNDYVIQTSVALVNELVSDETSESQAIYEQRIKVTIAQQTYTEKLLEQLLGGR